MSLIELTHICKTYDVKPPIEVLTGVDLKVEAGERIVIVGHSGAGKSTLLNIIGLLDNPTSGTYMLDGEDTTRLRARKLDHLRARKLGFVFQDYHVLPYRTVRENLELKLSINAIPRLTRHDLITQALRNVGLEHRSESVARLLSGGEKQRLAIARAIITSPAIILADEPTGNLDHENAQSVLNIFNQQAQRGVAVLVITHDERIAAWADRVLHLIDGKISS